MSHELPDSPPNRKISSVVHPSGILLDKDDKTMLGKKREGGLESRPPVCRLLAEGGNGRRLPARRAGRLSVRAKGRMSGEKRKIHTSSAQLAHLYSRLA